MNKLVTLLLSGIAATGFATIAAADSDQGKAAYYAAADQAAADFRDAHAKCDLLQGNEQLVCIEEAKLAQTRAKGTAEAHYRNTPQARQKASIDIANAEYGVAKARCEAKDGSDKEACIRLANALRSFAIAEAKSGRKIVAAGTDAGQTRDAGDKSR
jgi:hyperosmotically inducible protein